MRRLLTWLSWTLLLLVIGLVATLAMILERQALVERSDTFSPASIEQAKALFRANDPRSLRQGEQRTVAIPLALLDEGVNHLASRIMRGRGAFVLAGDRAGEMRVSVPAPGLGGALHLNMRVTITDSDKGIHIERAALGGIDLPAPWVDAVVAQVLCRAGYCQEWRLARGTIRKIAVQPARQTIAVTYVWETRLLDRARSIVLPADDTTRLREAQALLTSLLDGHSAGDKTPLATVLQAMLTMRNDDRRAQRRAALLVLAAYLAEKNIAALVPQARDWPRPRTVELTLRARHDTAQHFVISAALAAWADEPVAQAIGMYKELDDARRGSGFSFADLAADRAGARFGELVMRDDARLDSLLAAPVADAAIMPDQSDLPEYLKEPEFRRRFGEPDSVAFQNISQEIDHRLDSLPLYR